MKLDAVAAEDLRRKRKAKEMVQEEVEETETESEEEEDVEPQAGASKTKKKGKKEEKKLSRQGSALEQSAVDKFGFSSLDGNKYLDDCAPQDFPVTAQVTERIYDSATGRILLIPQGARLIGSYDSVVAFGQRRALVVWQRIVFPDGSSIRLENVPATDPSGYAGLADKVDFHTWVLLKGVVLSTLLGVGAELQFSGESDLVQALRESTQQSVSRAGDQLTSRNLQVQPTITVRPGAPVRLVVHQDIVLKPWQENQ